MAHSAFALNESPQTFTLDGQLFQAGTTNPLLDGSVKIKVQILNPAGTCLLYEEQQTVNTLTTDGHFNINVGSLTGSLKRSINDPGRTMNQIFQNMSAIIANDVPGRTCTGGFYSPTAMDVRYVRVIVTPSASNAPDTLTPDIVMDSVPHAIVAQSVQGLERTGILQVNNSGSTVLTQANLEALFTTPAYTNLQTILAGNFMKTDASGASLPSYATTPAGVSNGDIWFDSTTDEVKFKSSAGVQTLGSGGTASGISLASGKILVGNGSGNATAVDVSGDASLANTGVLTLNKVPVGKGGTNTTSFGNNHIIASNGTGTALVDFTCALNQVISFDASGNAACSYLSSLGGGLIINGGNTLGTDISIGTNDNNALKFKTNNTLAMTISQNGNVGIGTSTPSGTLEVNGGTAAASTDGTNITLTAQAPGAGNKNGGNIVLTPGGRTGTGAYGGVLIGYTTQPNWLMPNSLYLAGMVYSGLGYQMNSSASFTWGTGSAKIMGAGATNTTDYILMNTNATERLRIDGSGNVGVGISTPAAKLEVAGEVKVGNSGTACSAANKGAIRYNNATSVLEFCNGTGWNLVQAAACTDATPNVFAFADQANATASTLYSSDIIQISGINCSVPVSISGAGSPQYQICSDAACGTVVQGWTSSPSSVTNNQYIQTRLTTDAVGGSQFQATVIVGGSASVWSVTNAGGDCTGSPAIGTVCADGTIYAGLSPDGNVKMFTTRCDAGQTWDGVSSCTGSRSLMNWNNGTTTYTTTGATSANSGKTNSDTLVGLVDSNAPYGAASYCDTLNINGKTDWYLPSQNELNVMYNNRNAIRNFLTDNSNYWSSTEININVSYYLRMSDGTGMYNLNPKSFAYAVRCVRR